VAGSGERNALQMRDRELRSRLEVGWEYVRPGGTRARDRRYVTRFLQVLGGPAHMTAGTRVTCHVTGPTVTDRP
jgi:hypothetical protein